MPEERADGISLDDLFAAFGLDGSAAHEERTPVRTPDLSDDEVELFKALGIKVPSAAREAAGPEPLPSIVGGHGGEPDPPPEAERVPERLDGSDDRAVPHPSSALVPPQRALPGPAHRHPLKALPEPRRSPERRVESKASPTPGPGQVLKPKLLAEAPPLPEPGPRSDSEAEPGPEQSTAPEHSDAAVPEAVPQPSRRRGSWDGALIISTALGCLIAGACVQPLLDHPMPSRALSHTVSQVEVGHDAVRDAMLKGTAAILPSFDEAAMRPKTVTYSYAIEDANGAAHEVVEVASFDEDGLLSSCRITVEASSQQEADRILSDLRQQLGSGVVEGRATPEGATCVIEFSGSRYNEEAYESLLKKRMDGFKVVSRG